MVHIHHPLSQLQHYEWYRLFDIRLTVAAIVVKKTSHSVGLVVGSGLEKVGQGEYILLSGEIEDLLAKLEL